MLKSKNKWFLKSNNIKHVIDYLQPYSTAVETKERIQSFRCIESSPSRHKVEHVGQFYKISDSTRSRLFSYGGIPKSYQIQTKTFVETCLMVRKPALDIINCIKNTNFSNGIPRFVLYGKKGTGKSLTLAHVIHYALENEYLIVHIPWLGEWMRRSKDNSPSETKEGFVNINLDAAAWLVHFKNQNLPLLEKLELKTSQEYKWSKREETPANSNLIELVDHGINRIKFASDCIVALANEIKKLSSSGKCKTLVAIDGFNAFFYPYTRIRTEKREIVHPNKISITEGFLNLTKHDWKNSAAVLTVDEIAIAEEDQKSYLPYYLLGQDGFHHLDPFIPILVEKYSEKEFQSCMDYYKERRWVQPVPGLDEELSVLSSLNPYNLMQLCAPL